MSFSIRPMEEADIAQSVEIEKDAFPTHFPRISFRRELKDQYSSYLVAYWEGDNPECQSIRSTGSFPISENVRRELIVRLFKYARGLWSGGYEDCDPEGRFIVGFIGLWYAVDDAHIISIGVRRRHRGLGIGDLLLIGAFEQVISLGAQVVTLEVRSSNYIARNLYRKYGFKEQGIRKKYYVDNLEDAIIMTTDPVTVPNFAQNFRKLLRKHKQRWGPDGDIQV